MLFHNMCMLIFKWVFSHGKIQDLLCCGCVRAIGILRGLYTGRGKLYFFNFVDVIALKKRSLFLMGQQLL